MKGTKEVKTAVIEYRAINHICFENITNTFEILGVTKYCDSSRRLIEDTAVVYDISILTMKGALEDSGIEIMMNLTNLTARYGVIQNLLEHGKHVYTERILAATFGQVQKLAALAHEKGRLLCSAPGTFLRVAIRTARYLVGSDTIETVISCVVALRRDIRLLTEKFPYTSRPGGDTGIDVGIYYTTAMINILEEVKKVCGMSDVCVPEQLHYFVRNESFGGTYIQESGAYLAGSLQFKSRCIGTLHFNSRSTRTEKSYATLYKAEGILPLGDLSFFRGDVKVILKGQAEPVVSPHTHGCDDDDRGLGVVEVTWTLRRERVPRTKVDMALHLLEVLTGVIESGHAEHFYEMQTEFGRQSILSGGYLGGTYAMNQPEGALALQEMPCKACLEDGQYSLSFESSFWAS